MTKKEFVEKLVKLGYVCDIYEINITRLDYNGCQISIFDQKKIEIWISKDDGDLHPFTNFESAYNGLIKNKWYNQSLVRNDKINEIL